MPGLSCSCAVTVREVSGLDTPSSLDAASSRPEAAFPQGVGADGPQEVDPAEVGPIGLAEVELRLGTLPEQEAAEPLLSRRTDHEVRVGLALGVEVVGDVLDIDDPRELLQRGAFGGVLLEEGPYGVRDLAASAVPDGDVDDHPFDVGGVLRSSLEPGGGLVGEQ